MSNPSSVRSEAADLYETDLCPWTERQAGLLRVGRWRKIDAAHLAEEIASVGGSQRSEIRNRLVVLLLHLLTWAFQPEKRKYGWRASIIDPRLQIAGLIEVSPNLRTWPDHVLAKAYLPDLLDLGFHPGRPEADVV